MVVAFAIISIMNARTFLALTLFALLLAACGPSAAEQQAAVDTQVAALLSGQDTEAVCVALEHFPLLPGSRPRA